jgi:hypothetical protein
VLSKYIIILKIFLGVDKNYILMLFLILLYSWAAGDAINRAL